MKKLVAAICLIIGAATMSSCGASRHGGCPANSSSGVYRSL